MGDAAQHPQNKGDAAREPTRDALPVKVAILPALAGKRRKKQNVIVTAKYTFCAFPFSFWWLTIYELLSPFNRFANFFYFFIGFLQMQPSLNPSGSSTPTVT